MGLGITQAAGFGKIASKQHIASWHPLTLENKLKECPIQGNIQCSHYQ